MGDALLEVGGRGLVALGIGAEELVERGDRFPRLLLCRPAFAGPVEGVVRQIGARKLLDVVLEALPGEVVATPLVVGRRLREEVGGRDAAAAWRRSGSRDGARTGAGRGRSAGRRSGRGAEAGADAACACDSAICCESCVRRRFASSSLPARACISRVRSSNFVPRSAFERSSVSACFASLSLSFATSSLDDDCLATTSTSFSTVERCLWRPSMSLPLTQPTAAARTPAAATERMAREARSRFTSR